MSFANIVKKCYNNDEGNLHLRPVKESMEEIQRRINEVEAEATNTKLDLILENQKEILTLLYVMQ